MKTYTPPSREKIRTELERAGADENGQVAGALWIVGALHGLRRPKTPADEAEKLRRLQKQLDNALGTFETLTPVSKEWLETEVSQPMETALQALTFVLSSKPGGHRERAHEEFAESLQRYFQSAGLPVSMSEESPFVCIFAECIGMDPESAKTTLMRCLAR